MVVSHHDKLQWLVLLLYNFKVDRVWDVKQVSTFLGETWKLSKLILVHERSVTENYQAITIERNVYKAILNLVHGQFSAIELPLRRIGFE